MRHLNKEDISSGLDYECKGCGCSTFECFVVKDLRRTGCWVEVLCSFDCFAERKKGKYCVNKNK